MTDVRPFSSGSEGYDWRESNCGRCQKDGYRTEACAACPMEEAVAKGFILGTIPSELAVEYGATLSDKGPYCRMPRQCSQFAPPATCEFISRPKSRAKVKCGKAASSTTVAHGLTQSVCKVHAKRCADFDAAEPLAGVSSPRTLTDGPLNDQEAT